MAFGRNGQLRVFNVSLFCPCLLDAHSTIMCLSISLEKSDIQAFEEAFKVFSISPPAEHFVVFFQSTSKEAFHPKLGYVSLTMGIGCLSYVYPVSHVVV